MIPSATTQELSTPQLRVLTTALRARRPRQAAEHDIEIRSVPVRTCYETMMRLTGPREAVLDYAAFLFAEEGHGSPIPAPPLAVEEAHVDDETDSMSIVLSRGAYSPR